MSRHIIKSFSLIVVLMLVSHTTFASEKRYYRYTNQSGITVIDHQLPNEYTNSSYDIVNERGQIIEQVEGSLTPKALREKQRIEKALANKRKQEKLKARKLKALLRSFSSLEDIDRLRNTRLEAINVQVDITKNYISRLKRRLHQLEDKAVNYERHGKTLPPRLILDIKEAEAQLANNQNFLIEKTREKEAINTLFDEHMTEFSKLKSGN